jgi:hypothetical protein
MRLSRAIAFASVLVWLLSCGGGTPGQSVLDIVYGDDGSGGVTDRDGFEFPMFDTPDNPVPPAGCELILLHDTSAPLSIQVGGDIALHAKVIDFAAGGAASNVLVRFEVTEVTDLQGNQAQKDPSSGLESEAGYTDNDGLVHNRFYAGNTPGLAYTITFTPSCGRPKELKVIVTALPCGCLNVSLRYEGALPPTSLNTIRVYVLPSEYTCDYLAPEKPVPSTTLVDGLITDLYGTTQFDCIPAGNYYTVFATAKGPYNCIAASGCDDGVFLQPDKCRDLALQLYLATLNPTGRYDCTDHFDFTNVVKDCAGGITDPLECATASGVNLSQQICCVLYQLVTFFQTPGTTIIALVKDLAKQWIGSLIVDTFFGLFGDAVANIITDYLKNKSPQWLQDFFKVGEDTLGIITNLELYSDLVLSKLQSDFSIQGSHYWTGMALYWKFGCNPQDPNYDQCGKMVFGLDDLGNITSGLTCPGAQFPMNIFGGTFNASIADFNKFIMNLHTINLNYGRLVLFVLNEIIIAKLTNCQAHSVKDAAKLWLNCNDIGNGIFGQIAQWFGGTSQDVVNLCNNAVDFLLTPVDMFLGALSLDTELSLQGSALLADDDCDLKVDRITNGKYIGQIQTSASSQSSFTGTFEAKRK